MSVDQIIRRVIAQELERWFWKDDNIYLIRLWTSIHGQIAHNDSMS